MAGMRRLAILLLPLALAGCASSGAVSTLHDGMAPGSPFQLVGAGIPEKGGGRTPSPMSNEFRVDFIVLLSNVSDGEQYLESVSVSPVGGQTMVYEFNPVHTRVGRMIDEDEDLELEFVLWMRRLDLRPAPGRALPVRVAAHLRDGSGYVWTVEVPSWNLP